MKKKRSISFARAFLTLAIPLFLLILPLFFHHSGDNARVGPYGMGFTLLLAAVATGAFLYALIPAWLCQQTKSRGPLMAAILLLISMGACVIAAEIFLRFYIPDPFKRYKAWGHERSLFLGYQAQPNHTWQIGDATYHTDEFGFRVNPRHPNWAEESDTLRIFALGGSSAFGWGLSDGETWPVSLETALNEEMGLPQARIITASSIGHNSLQVLLRFYLQVLPLEPDVAVFYENRNEIATHEQKRAEILAKEEFIFAKTFNDYLRIVKPGANPYSHMHFGEAVERKALLRIRDKLFPSERKKRVWELGETLSERQREVMEHNAERYRTNLIALIDMARRNHVLLVLTTFAHDEARTDIYQTACMHDQNDVIREVATAENVPLIDVAAAMDAVGDKTDYFFKDAYHPSAKGSELIADTIAQGLAELIQTRAGLTPPATAPVPLPAGQPSSPTLPLAPQTP